MARTRLLHPQQTVDEDVNDLSIYARFVWAFLPCHADKEGRLLDKPFALKLAILPIDQVDMDALLAEIASKGFIIRYEVGGRRYIQIRSFAVHQHPHRKETESNIPPVPESNVPLPPDPGQSMDVPRADQGPALPGNYAAGTDLGPSLDNPAESQGPRNYPAGTVLGQSLPGGSGSGSGSGDLSPSRASARDPGAGPEPLAPTVVRSTEGIPPPSLEAPPAPDRKTSGYDLQRRFGELRAAVLGGFPWAIPASAEGKADTFAARLSAEDEPFVEITMRRFFEHVAAGDEDWDDERLRAPAFAFGAWMARFTELREELAEPPAPKRAAKGRRRDYVLFDPKAQPK